MSCNSLDPVSTLLAYLRRLATLSSYTALLIPEEVVPLNEAPPDAAFPSTSNNNIQPASQNVDDSADIASKKRKASDGLSTIKKTRKTSHDQQSMITPAQPAPPAIANQRPHITTSMLTQAPQAGFVVSGPPPPPAAEDDFAKPSNIVSMRAANSSKYNVLMKDRPLPNVCLPLNTDISVAELMTFFPNSVQIPLLATRFMRNGFKVQTLAKMQLSAIDDQDEKHAAKVEDKLKWQYKHAGECEWSHLKEVDRTSWSGIAKKEGACHDVTANHLKLRHEYPGWEQSQSWGHCKLSQVYEAVEDDKWPRGPDRMVLTQCLEFAKSNEHLDLDTSHWGWIAQHIGAQSPPTPAGYATRDEEAANRYASIYPTRIPLSNARRKANK